MMGHVNAQSLFKDKFELMAFLKKVPSTVSESYRREQFYTFALEKQGQVALVARPSDAASLKQSVSGLRLVLDAQKKLQNEYFTSLE